MSNQHLLRILTLTFLSFTALSFQNCSRTLTIELNEGEEVLASQQAVTTPAALEKTNFEPVLMDRYLLRSYLETIFGPSIQSVQSFSVTMSPSEYGSPCTPYENYQTEVGTRVVAAVPMEACAITSAAFTSAGTNPKASVTRQAELPKLCSDLTHTTATYQFAIKQISSTSLAPAVNNVNLVKAFQLFYREKPLPPQSLIDALGLLVAEEGKTTSADWQNILYTICASGHWQVL